ncbi:MAG: hypothetical protein KGK01_17115 [Bradyrhizobium sp.]|uniref:hypothetical protein n=1 Tax=Bradyrhizobium sp. TaxID=376 RepID=UPI001C2902F6|nr:hypothetical protein [Bradyrhizobium sp.]MBU6464525.1 hypothetical protein [Pseudomonadota bacterium]MDE2069398.1 hypothetical protein [Bradyrhizobium sp.]MDE2244083.1 hypothetical protein [Bradyrhizobium sp.]MDE2468472.1 hypothetical protein [Bradyrhizobium sp.]
MRIIYVLVALVVVVGLYKLRYPTYTYRYRMTVEIDAGGEIRSHSSVIEVSLTRQPRILPEVLPFHRSAQGQAVFIELPAGKNLVALLASGAVGEHRDFPFDVIPQVFKIKNVEDLPKLRGRRELAADQMPTLVTVANPGDAKTVQVVKLASIDSLLGVHLRSISVEMTTDSVPAPDIERHLPFLVQARERQRSEIGYPNVFTPFYSSFIRW